MKRPLLWGIIALGLSIAFAYYRVPVWAILLCSGLLGFLPLVVKRIKQTQIIFVLGIFCGGIILGYGAFPLTDPMASFYDKEVLVTAVVTDYPIIKDDRMVVNIKTKQIVTTKNEALKKAMGLKVTIYFETIKDQPVFNPGDILAIKGTLSKPSGKRNPGGFDYGLYLKSQAIDGLLVAPSGGIDRVSRESSLYFTILSIKRHFETQCDTYFSEDVSDLLKGVIFGEKDIGEDLTQSFQNAGVTHVLSVSGLHVGYVFLAISFILITLKMNKKFWMLFLLPALLFYVALTGFVPPVVRATIMIVCLTIGQGIHREKDPLNQLCLAGLIILCLWPSQLFQAGFQLSMGAMLGIILFYEPLLFLCKKQRNKKSPRIRKNMGPIIEGLILTFCATLGTLPILLYHFKTFTLLSFLSNLLVVPLIGIFLLAGMIFLLIAGLFPFLALLFSMPLAFLGKSILVMLDGINDLGKALDFLLINRGGLTIVESCIFLLFSFLISGYFFLKSRRVKNTVLAVGCVLGLLLILLPLYPKNLVVTILDVGQGDSILIETPSGLNYLIDGGGYLFPKASEISESVLYPVLYSKNIRKLDGVFLTHNHVDHCQGIEELVFDKFPVQNLFMSINTNSETLLNQSTVPVTLLEKGSVIQGKDGVRIEVYSPSGEISPKEDDEQNNVSLVMCLSYKGTNMLFCGDIEAETERLILNDMKAESAEKDFQVIKIPHHGSKSSSTQEFLTAVDPEMAVISVGAHNSFGHPNDEVLRRLDEQDINTLRTDKNGAVEITSNGEWIHYKTYAD
ncbi:DNA internalization-related competence protein ComEC/Rec2 [Acetobacterium paludosum]|uniref:DNA internalization-related competence protein ComEC/Rec2 n=1 Tax=Acetobacterium paludosum TaxID=52693 RepID=A0A923HYE8_9FIRM|nr:DNA internalization-related competence protein ComEC/Rec2 [Acetobacterium paludosum]MBC3889437.1 DNA internalization-related competence protein ComEC/Rec2 [Acetobacterium paludosum]